MYKSGAAAPGEPTAWNGLKPRLGEALLPPLDSAKPRGGVTAQQDCLERPVVLGNRRVGSETGGAQSKEMISEMLPSVRPLEMTWASWPMAS